MTYSTVKRNILGTCNKKKKTVEQRYLNKTIDIYFHPTVYTVNSNKLNNIKIWLDNPTCVCEQHLVKAMVLLVNVSVTHAPVFADKSYKNEMHSFLD